MFYEDALQGNPEVSYTFLWRFLNEKKGNIQVCLKLMISQIGFVTLIIFRPFFVKLIVLSVL